MQHFGHSAGKSNVFSLFAINKLREIAQYPIVRNDSNLSRERDYPMAKAATKVKAKAKSKKPVAKKAKKAAKRR
jgi:hypothetical protein